MRCRVLIFAKPPVIGSVKTRLAGCLGPRGAAALYRRLVRHSVATAIRAQVGDVVICAAPPPADATDEDHAALNFLPALARRYGLAIQLQYGADLGERMANAIRDNVSENTAAMLIGSDCAALSCDYLRDAAAALRGPHDVLLGPTEDGGYFLVGMRAAHRALFEGIAWSTPAVLEQTRARLRVAGLRFHELAPIWDIDTERDLLRLRSLGEFTHRQRSKAFAQ